MQTWRTAALHSVASRRVRGIRPYGGAITAYFRSHPPAGALRQLYNLSNPDEVVDGGRPSVKLHGPYTYMETMDRHDVEFSKDLKTVSFEEFQQFHFVPAMSVSRVDTPPLPRPPTLLYRGGAVRVGVGHLHHAERGVRSGGQVLPPPRLLGVRAAQLSG